MKRLQMIFTGAFNGSCPGIGRFPRRRKRVTSPTATALSDSVAPGADRKQRAALYGGAVIRKH